MTDPENNRPKFKVQIERDFASPVEKVFEAWTNTEIAMQWQTPEDMSLLIDGEFKKGNTIKQTLKFPTFDIDGTIKVLEMEKNKRLLVTIRWNDFDANPGDPIDVEIIFKEIDENNTNVNYSQELVQEDTDGRNAQSFELTLDALEAYLKESK